MSNLKSEALQVTSPYDGHVIRDIPWNTESELEKFLSTAHSLHENRSAGLPGEERIAILERTIQLFENRKEDFAKQAAEEGGKPLIDSRVEVNRGMREQPEQIGSVRPKHSTD